MKKNTIQTIILAVLVVVVTVGMVTHFTQTNSDKEYSRPGVIIDNETIRTDDGNIWKYDTKYNKGSEVKVSFNNKDTETIFDDEVIKVELR